jgi:hypothetical protein
MFFYNLCLGQKVYYITELSWSSGKKVAAVEPYSYLDSPSYPQFIFKDSTLFLNGKPFTGKAKSSDISAWNYTFVKGKLEGKTRSYWGNDKTLIEFEYNFKDGVLNGEWFYYNNNKSLAMKGNYTNGLKEGEEISYHSSNQWPQNPGAETIMYKGNLIKGVHVGAWTAFDRSQTEIAWAIFDSSGKIISCSGNQAYCEEFKQWK